MRISDWSSVVCSSDLASTARNDRAAKDTRQIVPARFMRDRIPLKSAALAHWNGFPCQKRFIAFEPLGPQHQRVRRDPVPFLKNADVALNDLAARHPHGPARPTDKRTRRLKHQQATEKHR